MDNCKEFFVKHYTEGQAAGAEHEKEGIQTDNGRIK